MIPGRGLGVVGYVHFSVLAFGLAAISTSLGQIILPLRVLDVAPESLKNTYLGVLTFIGMGVAMLGAAGGRVSERQDHVEVGAAAALHCGRGFGGHRADGRRGGGSELREPAGDVGAGAVIR